MHFPMASRIPILGVPIDPVTMEEAVTCVLSMLHGLKQCHVMTPNNEMLVEADRNAAFKSVLQRSDLNLPDSTGLLWAARRTGERIPERVSGVDFVERLCGALDQSIPVFFLGGRGGAAEKAAEKFGTLRQGSGQVRNAEFGIAGVYEGSPREEDAQ